MVSPTMPGRFNQDAEIFLDLLLTNVLIQRSRTQTGFQERFISVDSRDRSTRRSATPLSPQRLARQYL